MGTSGSGVDEVGTSGSGVDEVGEELKALMCR